MTAAASAAITVIAMPIGPSANRTATPSAYCAAVISTTPTRAAVVATVLATVATVLATVAAVDVTHATIDAVRAMTHAWMPPVAMNSAVVFAAWAIVAAPATTVERTHAAASSALTPIHVPISDVLIVLATLCACSARMLALVAIWLTVCAAAFASSASRYEP